MVRIIIVKCVKKTLSIIGIVAIICAAFGLFYNLRSVGYIFSDAMRELDKDAPYFYPAYFIMSGVCVICYLLLMASGIQFLRGRLGWISAFIALLIFEVVYFFAVAFLWMLPGIGRTVAAASGVANGGLMFQFVILFPLWGGILAYRAKRRLEQSI